VKRLIFYKGLICWLKKNNRSYKRLIEFDKSHKWNVLDLYFGKQHNLLDIYYKCSKCNMMKCKTYLDNQLSYSNTPEIFYGKRMESLRSYNCAPCNYSIIESILE